MLGENLDRWTFGEAEPYQTDEGQTRYRVLATEHGQGGTCYDLHGMYCSEFHGTGATPREALIDAVAQAAFAQARKNSAIFQLQVAMMSTPYRS